MSALGDGARILATMNKNAAPHFRIALPDSIIQSYVGIYEQDNRKKMKVVMEGNGIKVSGDGLPTVILFPVSKTKFYLDCNNVQLEFPDSKSLIVCENGKQVMKISHK